MYLARVRIVQVAKNAVVVIDYTLTDDSGEIVDTSDGRDPLPYLHGSGGIIPGLERELEGKVVGDQIQVSVTPEDGYGKRDDALRREVPREQFDDIDEVELGMQFQVESDAGPIVVSVVEIADDFVTIDGNHPLADMNLNFDVTILEIREATTEEIEHGHAHGPGGHAH